MWTSRNVAALLLSSLMLSGLRVPSATARLPDPPTGGGPGVSAQLEMDGDWTIAVLSNLDPPSGGEAASMLRRLSGAVDRACE